jgi:hypothetical protein
MFACRFAEGIGSFSCSASRFRQAGDGPQCRTLHRENTPAAGDAPEKSRKHIYVFSMMLRSHDSIESPRFRFAARAIQNASMAEGDPGIPVSKS